MTFPRHLLEPFGGDIAVVVLRGHDRERLLAVRDGVLEDPVDIALDQEGQEIDARRRDADVGRERDHRPARRFCRRRRRPHVVGEHRPEDELRPRAEFRLSGLSRGVGARMVILDHQGDGGTAEIVDRQLRSVAHRDADRAWAAVLGQRQDHADPNRACAQRLADGGPPAVGRAGADRGRRRRRSAFRRRPNCSRRASTPARRQAAARRVRPRPAAGCSSGKPHTSPLVRAAIGAGIRAARFIVRDVGRDQGDCAGCRRKLWHFHLRLAMRRSLSRPDHRRILQSAMTAAKAPQSDGVKTVRSSRSFHHRRRDFAGGDARSRVFTLWRRRLATSPT